MAITKAQPRQIACCLIEKDTEVDAYGAEYQFHCLIIEDTVANVRRNE